VTTVIDSGLAREAVRCTPRRESARGGAHQPHGGRAARGPCRPHRPGSLRASLERRRARRAQGPGASRGPASRPLRRRAGAACLGSA
jgi:hypothetical protein